MRIILFDIDTLRPDHLGCYGYGRETSPDIDAIAADGVRFTDYYCPNAPCLPSRASLITGQYGIHTGVVGHGGTAADLRLQGESRHFTDVASENGLFSIARRAGLYTVSFSTFAERHSAWWFNAGLNECHNVGKRGNEIAGEVTDAALDWLSRNRERGDYLLHIHYWDPHTPYRAPEDFGNPFADEPLPDGWITPERFAEHKLHVGPHGANEINMWDDQSSPAYPRHPGRIDDLDGVKAFIDNYDCGVRYANDQLARVIAHLKAEGLYEDAAIIVTADHGENLGELGLYAEHGTADEPTCHIPMIIKWPGGPRGAVQSGFFDNVDLAPTLAQLLGVADTIGGYRYDGVSYAPVLSGQPVAGKESLVLTQCAHVCQRSVRFGDYLYLRTVHGGYHLFPREMLFNVREDPHQCHDLAPDHPELCAQGARLMMNWLEEMMKNSPSPVDPLWTVMAEGGPEHCRGALAAYLKRLEGTDRAYGIARLKAQYPHFK
ncbi:MAG: sulfatase [Christensenellales bacterium]|jgi:choline-sulfatase